MNKQHFLVKLYNILNDDEYQNICSWSNDGNSFLINEKNINKFIKEMNMTSLSSFKRKLCFYKFKIIKNILRDSHYIEFKHSYFNKHTELDLTKVTRKVNNQNKELKELNELLLTNIKLKIEIEQYKNKIKYNEIILEELTREMSDLYG